MKEERKEDEARQRRARQENETVKQGWRRQKESRASNIKIYVNIYSFGCVSPLFCYRPIT